MQDAMKLPISEMIYKQNKTLMKNINSVTLMHYFHERIKIKTSIIMFCFVSGQ